jgi:hypothetical protein
VTYEIVFDAGARVFELRPILMLIGMPVFIVLVLVIGKWQRGSVPGGAKTAMWGAYALYLGVVSLSYFGIWREQSEAADRTDARVVEGRVADSWMRTKARHKITDIYQHFTVKGIEFLQTDRERNFMDFLFPHRLFIRLPIDEGARVRITYRGRGSERTILRFEIAAEDMPEGQVRYD